MSCGGLSWCNIWCQCDAFWRLVVVDFCDVAAVWYRLKMGEDLYLQQVLPSHEDVICSVRFYATEWRPFASLFALMTWNFLC